MAFSSSTTSSWCCAMRPLSSARPHHPHAFLRLSSISTSLRNNSISSLSFSKSLSAFPLTLPTVLRPVPTGEQKQQRPLAVVAAKAKQYKMKTHKASAKRFRVTGNGKIIRRKSGKQHLLGKKNTKRKNRLSKMTSVNRNDLDNVIGALPYLKFNRKAK